MDLCISPFFCVILLCSISCNVIRGSNDGSIAGPDAISYAQAAEILSNEIGRKIKYVDISEDQAREGMKAMGMDEWFINSMMDLFSITRAGYASDISSAIEEVTGKKPITFSEFAKDHSSAFK